MRTYFWDFGEDGHGEGSARQYLLLLDDFLRDHRLECETGVLRKERGGFSAFCKAPVAARPVIEKILGPVRFCDDPAERS